MFLLWYINFNCYFIIANETLLVAYGDGRNWPGCPDNADGASTDTILKLNCTPEAEWEYSGNKGDASSYLSSIIPDPFGCLVRML